MRRFLASPKGYALRAVLVDVARIVAIASLPTVIPAASLFAWAIIQPATCGDTPSCCAVFIQTGGQEGYCY